MSSIMKSEWKRESEWLGCIYEMVNKLRYKSALCTVTDRSFFICAKKLVSTFLHLVCSGVHAFICICAMSMYKIVFKPFLKIRIDNDIDIDA